MGKKILIGSIICIFLIAIPSIVLIWKSSQNNNSYIYSGRSMSLGDYSITNDKLEVVFIGKLENMYSANDGMVYGTITYGKTGKKRIFLIPTHIPQKYDLLVLFEPKTNILTNVEKEKQLYPDVSGIKQLQGRTMAFYLPIFDPYTEITPVKQVIYREYFDFVNTHVSCNKRFAQELAGSLRTSTCAPFIETIVVKI